MEMRFRRWRARTRVRLACVEAGDETKEDRALAVAGRPCLVLDTLNPSTCEATLAAAKPCVQAKPLQERDQSL